MSITTMADDSEDKELLRRIAARDRSAFKTLYERYATRIGSYQMKLLHNHDLVSEAVNDTLMAVWQSAENYDPERARASTWLFGIAHHKALKALARATPRQLVPLDDVIQANNDDNESGKQHALTSNDNPEHSAIGNQLGSSLAEALAELSAEHRAVIELAFVESLGYEDIARIMDCPVNTVKTRMFHARKKLSALMVQRGHSP